MLPSALHMYLHVSVNGVCSIKESLWCQPLQYTISGVHSDIIRTDIVDLDFEPSTHKDVPTAQRTVDNLNM